MWTCVIKSYFTNNIKQNDCWQMWSWSGGPVGWYICSTLRNWLRELNQLQASPDQLSTLCSFVWIPSWHSGQFLARVQASSEYNMTASAVSFLSTVFFFGRRRTALSEYSQSLLSWRPTSSDKESPQIWLQTPLLRKRERKVSNADDWQRAAWLIQQRSSSAS